MLDTDMCRYIIKEHPFKVLNHLDVMTWDVAAADQYAVIRTELEAKGEPIGAMDMMIAAHSKSINAVLVTNNQKHFRKVQGLEIENWV